MYKQFCLFRNKVQCSIRKAKQNYYNDKVEESKGSSSELWKTLKSLNGISKTSKGSSNIGLMTGEEIIFDKATVADTFNTFFTTVAAKLVQKLPVGSGKYTGDFAKEYYKEKGVKLDSFKFSVISESDILKLLLGISPRKATGLDKLPAKFIRDGALPISAPIAHIVNISLFSGHVPEDMKIARVVPLYKKNSKTDPGNYRPVSILSVMSNFLERVVYTQLEQHMKNQNLFYNFQSGFRTSFSTDTCLTHLSDSIRSEMDSGNFTGMVLIDLQKAFDTVDHPILLKKLEAIGLTNSSVTWFDSYLTNRKQVVDNNGTFSDPRTVPCGVPQGSILGPLLFLIYVNDMESAVSCRLILYADDSALVISGKDISAIQNKLGEELKSLREWLIDNKLSLHLGKTESILFGSRRKLKTSAQLNVQCDGINVPAKESVCYLGVELDQTLSGSKIAEKILMKGNSRLNFLFRQSKCLNRNSRKLLASALIQCHFDYACSAWYSGLTKSFKTKIQTLQNKVIRFVLGLPPRSHIGLDRFQEIRWLPVCDRVAQIKSNNMHRVVHGDAPSYLKEGISMVNEVHGIGTRHSRASVSMPRVESSGSKSFRYTATKIWNSLPYELKSINELAVFKLKIRKHLWNELRNRSNAIYVYE